MLTIVFMAVTSAGSAEMMAVSSLVTYDIYKVGSLMAYATSSKHCRRCSRQGSGKVLTRAIAEFVS